MILVSRHLASYKYNELYRISNFHSASITLILLQWEWCHLPLLQGLQLMLPHLVLIERAVSRLFSICKCCGKGTGQLRKGHSRQLGGPSAAGRGTRYFARSILLLVAALYPLN